MPTNDLQAKLDWFTQEVSQLGQGRDTIHADMLSADQAYLVNMVISGENGIYNVASLGDLQEIKIGLAS